MPLNAMGAGDSASVSSALTLSITPTAQIAIVTNATFSMALGGATQAGAAVSDSSINSASRLRISSLVDATTRSITAIATSITATNTQLWVQLGAPNGNFNGAKGTLAASQNLTSGDSVTLASEIATCWSGIGGDDGYSITYIFRRGAGTVFTSPGAVVVTYTLSGAV